MFLFQIHQITGIQEEAAVWESKVDSYNNPGASPYIESLFDGLTLGAFSNGNIFAVADKEEAMGQDLKDQWASLVQRNDTATYYRNWGLIIAIGGLIVGKVMKKSAMNTPQTN